jgi:thiamine-phosphate pyrophosphorylase
MKEIAGLYGITVDQDHYIERNVKLALEGGARVIQYRNKAAKLTKATKVDQLSVAEKLADLCRQYEATYIINDNVELALAVNADGIHLGKKDLNIKSAREKIGSDKIIGVSCYNKLELAIEAEQQGADYIAFGRFFPSVTKPEAVAADMALLIEARKRLTLPIVAIGGINIDNAGALIQAGATSVAVIDGLFNQNNIKKFAQDFSNLFR